MTVPIPALPEEGNRAWYAYITAFDAAVRELQAMIIGISPPAGFISTINGFSPDIGGNLALTAAAVDAMSSGYQPGLTDMPITVADYVYKSAGGAGVWPTGYSPAGVADYTGGVANAGYRPHGVAKPVIWVGYPPFPGTVDSGQGGMLRGWDQMAIPEP